ncbi:MAG TPA: outer membrane beta-barrel protein [Kofleriaceae bacterium]|nr:outer membrane beta-barrel protein [Kofleriaceae bacterium]
MKRALAVGLVVGWSSVASAGGYVGLGIGTGPGVGTDAADTQVSSDGRSYRLLGGVRLSRFAIEGAIGQMDTRLADNTRGQPYETYQASISAKYHLPLDAGFEAFGKVGLHKVWFDNAANRPDLDVEGSGLLFGGGFQYRLDAVLASAALFVEYQYASADVRGERLDWGSTSVRMWTLGATVGF